MPCTAPGADRPDPPVPGDQASGDVSSKLLGAYGVVIENGATLGIEVNPSRGTSPWMTAAVAVPASGRS
ncbi:MAG: hypothetical protein ACRDST_23810 [Pseudonocardiaceae bacterium]